ncbi:MAG: 3-hydroxyacyl-CoA dehydrogenase/enoyl-CoA hydratase family protein [Deltaproteobacteria bacterium]|nr:3-hydroxyacyl-CoA dehydrogenase/enoyl-CoA hydratase family protein [Deltaproteobacteria bacterium]
MTRKIRKAAVIGSGIMGGGIAALLASAGIDTLLLDIVPFDLNEDQKNDRAAKNKIVQAGFDQLKTGKPAAFMSSQDMQRISLGNLEDNFEELALCDWIVEAVVENLEVKQSLFKRIEKIRKADAIVTSNTSGIPLRSMTHGLNLKFCQNFMGTHFFNPVRYMHLLELIPGQETLKDVVDFMADFGNRILGKGIVWAKDTPNFVGNRIGVFNSGNTINTMVEESMSIPEVDALIGPAIGRAKSGVFRTLDMVGIDTMIHITKNIYELVPDDPEKNRFLLPGFFDTMMEKKMLGNKTRGGFYKREKNKAGKPEFKVLNTQTFEYESFENPAFPCLEEAKKVKTVPEKLNCVIYGKDRGARFVWKTMARTLIYAANCIPEISDTILEIDNAMRWGYNASFGPFQTWDAIGLEISVARMEKEGFKVPGKIKNMLSKGYSSFYKTENNKNYYYCFEKETYLEKPVSPNELSLSKLKIEDKTIFECESASLIDLGDNVFCCEFHTKMNALNAEIVDFIDKSLDYVDTNGAGLVFGNQDQGMPGAFSAGANLKLLLERATTGDFDSIASGLKKMQTAMQKVRYSAFPVVAAPYGMTLGGGCEICLGSDRIVAHSELYMGLVEIGVGLLPGGAGCLNLWKKIFNNLPGPLARDADLIKIFIPVFSNIAMAKVSTSAAHARSNGYIGVNDRIVFNRDALVAEAKKEVLRMNEDGYTPPIKTKIFVMGDQAQGMISAQFGNMLHGKFLSEHDAFLAKRIAYVISGGDVRPGTLVDEDVILTLEGEAFIDFLKKEKTIARMTHLLKTGKPLRN